MTIKVLSAGGVAPPLIDVAKLFSAKYKQEIMVVPGKAEELIEAVKKTRDADILCVGAEHVMDFAQGCSIIDKNSRKTIGYRRSVLLVQYGNPKNIRRLEDITKDGISISISGTGCLVGVWDDITSGAGLTDKVRQNIAIIADGCGHLIRTITLKEVDVAFGWNVFATMFPKAIQAVELPENLQVRRSTNIAIFTFSDKVSESSRFIEFLQSQEAKALYKKYDWEV